MSARPERPRAGGFTLLELMVASAVGLVIIFSALAAFDLQQQFSRNTERLLGAQASAGLGLTMMQRDLENAGLRFRGGVQTTLPATAYAAVVRVYDNLGAPNANTLRNDPAGAITVDPVTAAGGFIPGTDAFEVYQGSAVPSAQRLGAQVAAVTPMGPTQIQLTVNPNPFTVNELAAAGPATGPVLMLWLNDVHCMGRMVANVTPPGGLTTVVVSTVNADFGVPGPPWPAGCPSSLQNVEVLENRRRYLVYQTVDASPGRPARMGLAVQSNAPCDPLGVGTVCSVNLGPPALVAEGVDDMQISWRVPTGVSPLTQGWCQRSINEASCGFEQPGAADDPVVGRRMAAIIGAQIFLASHGQETYRRPGEQVPQLLNHVPAVAVDGVVRTVMQTSLTFRNMVNP